MLAVAVSRRELRDATRALCPLAKTQSSSLSAKPSAGSPARSGLPRVRSSAALRQAPINGLTRTLLRIQNGARIGTHRGDAFSRRGTRGSGRRGAGVKASSTRSLRQPDSSAASTWRWRLPGTSRSRAPGSSQRKFGPEQNSPKSDRSSFQCHTNALCHDAKGAD